METSKHQTTLDGHDQAHPHMSRLATNTVIYEQPLNERMRAFLRLEHLFDRARHRLSEPDMWASRASLDAVIDIMNIMSRTDLKTEFIKELDRHAATLETLEKNPKVDLGRLDTILSRIREILATLRTRDDVPGHELRQNELLSMVRQRHSIPAGTCDFDLPGFHFWLQSEPEQRIGDLTRWLSAYDIVRDAVTLCLTLVRESARVTHELAEAGFFQRTLEKGVPFQLVRVALAGNAPWYPEISAGRHRFSVRFMLQGNAEARPTQTHEAVEFDLLCCVI